MYLRQTNSIIRSCTAFNNLGITSVIDGGWLKFHHISTPLHLMVPPWQAFLHKLLMAVGKKSAMPWCRHGCYLTTLGITQQLF